MPFAVCAHRSMGAQSLRAELEKLGHDMLAQVQGVPLTAVVTVVQPFPSHLTQGLGFALPFAPELRTERKV